MRIHYTNTGKGWGRKGGNKEKSKGMENRIYLSVTPMASVTPA